MILHFLPSTFIYITYIYGGVMCTAVSTGGAEARGVRSWGSGIAGVSETLRCQILGV